MPELESFEVVRCFIAETKPQMVVLVIDDTEDDAIVKVIAEDDPEKPQRFGGVWQASREPGESPVLGFRLIELGAGPGGLDRLWFVRDPADELLDVVRRVPHNVAVMPAEIAGVETGAGLMPRLTGSLLVQVEHTSGQVDRFFGS